MAACTLLRSVTGFNLVFQSKCLRMNVAACVVHVLIQFLVQKEKATSWTKCFYGIFRFEKRLLTPELLSATAVAKANFTSIFMILSNQ